jgi:protoporphyrinogen/coproporphyrinogen III oxidase
MIRVAIIGGGITGLSAAYYLSRAGIDFILYEASSRLGGLLRSERINDFVVEAGPDSFLSNKPWAAELAHEIGIGEQLTGSQDALRKTYILVDGKLVAMPPGLQLMVPASIASVAFSPLFSFTTKWRMALERFFPPSPLSADKDESVADFTRRHFGQQAVDRLANPLLAGVYGGDSGTLSARAVLPRLVELESQYRSLSRGILATRGISDTSPSIFTSFRGGMQQFTGAIAARIDPGCVRLRSPAEAIFRTSGDWSVRAAGAGGTFSHLIIAVPAFSAARLVWGFAPDLAALLNQIRYTSSITVSLVDVPQPLPAGFGFLVPRSEHKQIIACTFVHNKFAGRAPAGKHLLRAFLTSGFEYTDVELLELVQRELGEILRTKITCATARIHRWPDAMPQYEVGHLDRMAAIDQACSRHPGLFVIGNAYRGVGIPDCVREAKQTAERILAR